MPVASDISAFNFFEVSSSGARIVYSSDIQSMAECTHGWGANLGIMGPYPGNQSEKLSTLRRSGLHVGIFEGRIG